MKPVLADASAVIAYLNFEPGADEVRKCLPRIRLAMANLAEIVAVVFRHRVSRSWVEEHIFRVFPEALPFDREQAYLCGALEAITRPNGLSLGDRACLALALERKATAYTADRNWKNLSLGIEIEVIR
jgi:ribonuclease VapC